MKLRIYFLYIHIAFLICFLSCQKENINEWIHIQNEDLYIWTATHKQNYTYSWNGGSFDKLIHGNGILSIYINDSLVSQKTITAYYGTISSNDIITLSDESSYIGEIQNDLFNGFGVYLKGRDIYVGSFIGSNPNGSLNWYKNGKRYYSGEWTNGKFCGRGILYKEDGSIKQGTWKDGKLLQTHIQQKTAEGFYNGYVLNNKPDGRGCMLYNDSSCYDGEWANGKLNGSGVYKNKSLLYNGDWVDNKPDGFGYVTTSDSAYYSGEWSEGKRNGYGDMYFSNKDSYFGDWRDNEFDGLGTYTFGQGGDIYYGEWKSGLQHGLGAYTSKEYEYVGNWEEGWINGKGRITYINQDFYEGDFVENKLYGQGYFKFQNGNSYEGEFVEGKFKGLGIFRFADGNIYEGEFEDGKIKGDGTLYYVEGKDTIAITANWDGSNNFPKQASVLFGNGDLYEGELINGFPTGNGTWTTEAERTNPQSGVYDSAKRANEFYKKHRDSWNKFVKYTSIALTVVEVTVPVVGVVLASTGVGVPIGGALITVGKVAGVANMTLNVADATIATASAAVNTYDAIQNGEDATETLTALGVKLSVNAAFVITPKVLKSVPARNAGVLLSSSAKSIKGTAKESIVTLSKRNKIFGKVVRISKDQTGKIQKTLEKSVPIQSLKKLNSTVNKKFESTFLKTILTKTLLYKDLRKIKDKGAILLTKKEMDYLMANADKANLKSFIKKYTGSANNYLEFFIRLSMGNKEQAAKILEQPDIRKFIDKSIRTASGETGYHEWLMTSNFKSFLLDGKWGDDGFFLAMAQSRLIQKTRNVNFKGGGGHVSSGRPNSTVSAKFHDGLAEVINKCNSKEELFVEVRAYAKEVLTAEAYKEFNEIFKYVLRTVEK